MNNLIEQVKNLQFEDIRAFIRSLELIATLPREKDWILQSFIYILNLNEENNSDVILAKKECCDLFYSSLMYLYPLGDNGFIDALKNIKTNSQEIQLFLESICITLCLKKVGCSNYSGQ